MRFCLLLPVGLLLLLGAVGCTPESRREGPELAKVTGSITLDGEPLAGAHIRFSPETKGPAAFGVSDERGRYELRTYEPDDGAVPGKYGISITKEVTQGGMEFESEAAKDAYVKENGEPPARETTNTVPEKYSSKKTSELTAEITLAKKNRIDLPLVSE